MPLLADRIQETSTTTGTGTLILGGAVSGYRTFNAAFANGNVVFYTIDDTLGNWEVGYGTVGSGTLTRDAVLESSNADNEVSFGSGVKRVFCSAPTRALLPNQTSNSGKFLTSDGISPSWATISQMSYPSAGIAVSTGSAWGSSLSAPSGALVGTTDSQILTNKTISGADNTLSNIANASLTNSSITFGATSQALGSTVSALNAVSIGQSTAAAGAFTTLSASSTVSGTGFSTYLASPPAIGGTTPAAGAFTTLSASSTVSGTGFSTYLASPPAIGGTTPAAGNFTTLSASSTVSGTGFSTYLASPPAIGGTAPAAGSFTNFSYTGTLTGGTGVINIGSGQLYKDASGNVGIGTSSPATILHVAAATYTTSVTVSNGSGASEWQQNGNNDLYISNYTASGAAIFRTNSTARLRITSDGNYEFKQNTGSGNNSVSFDTTIQNALTLDSSGVLSTYSGIEVSGTNSGNRNAYIDFHSDNTYPDYSLRIIATPGANGLRIFEARGTGGINITVAEAGPIGFSTSNVERLRIDSSGNLISTAVYAATVGATNRDLYIDNTGKFGYVSSLRASKVNIEDLTDTSWLSQLNPVSFNYRKKAEDGSYTDEIDGDIQYGMIAEDVEMVRPDLCFYDETENGLELRGIQYSKLVPVMLKAIQELHAEIEQLKQRIN